VIISSLVFTPAFLQIFIRTLVLPLSVSYDLMLFNFLKNRKIPEDNDLEDLLISFVSLF